MPCSFEILSQIVPFVEPFQSHSKNCIKSPAVLARGPLPLVLADARSPAVLAPAPDALVLADARSPAFLALAPDALVLADWLVRTTPSLGCCSGVGADHSSASLNAGNQSLYSDTLTDESTITMTQTAVQTLVGKDIYDDSDRPIQVGWQFNIGIMYLYGGTVNNINIVELFHVLESNYQQMAISKVNQYTIARHVQFYAPAQTRVPHRGGPLACRGPELRAPLL